LQRVGDFRWLANDAIQPLEVFASKSLNYNSRYCGGCGLQEFDTPHGGDGEKKTPERGEGGVDGATWPGGEVRRNPLNSGSGIRMQRRF